MAPNDNNLLLKKEEVSWKSKSSSGVPPSPRFFLTWWAKKQQFCERSVVSSSRATELPHSRNGVTYTAPNNVMITCWKMAKIPKHEVQPIFKLALNNQFSNPSLPHNVFDRPPMRIKLIFPLYLCALPQPTCKFLGDSVCLFCINSPFIPRNEPANCQFFKSDNIGYIFKP